MLPSLGCEHRVEIKTPATRPGRGPGLRPGIHPTGVLNGGSWWGEQGVPWNRQARPPLSPTYGTTEHIIHTGETSCLVSLISTEPQPTSTSTHTSQPHTCQSVQAYDGNFSELMRAAAPRLHAPLPPYGPSGISHVGTLALELNRFFADQWLDDSRHEESGQRLGLCDARGLRARG